MAVLSVVPNFYYYWIDAGAALNIAQICNDWVADFCRKHPDRFRGMADIPMQDPELALSELRRAHETLGLNALATAPMICETHLDDERFFPIYEYCEAHDILVYLHPCFEKAREELKDYYNTNFVGNVYQTNLGLNNLILGGVFETYPKLEAAISRISWGGCATDMRCVQSRIKIFPVRPRRMWGTSILIPSPIGGRRFSFWWIHSAATT